MSNNKFPDTAIDYSEVIEPDRKAGDRDTFRWPVSGAVSVLRVEASDVRGLASERPANVVKMRESGRRRNTSVRRLTPNQIVGAAVKIIGEGRARRADVQAIVEKMSKLCELSKRARSSESKNQKQFAKQYSAALRKVIAVTRNASTDFRPPQPLLRVSAPQLGIDNEVFDHEHLLRHLALLKWISESWEKSKLGKPKPNADEKRLAADAALHLLKMHGIDSTTTKTGAFCKLAAVLYGDKSADLQHQCRAVLSRAQIRVKNSPGNALGRES